MIKQVQIVKQSVRHPADEPIDQRSPSGKPTVH